ncbi:MAG: protein kinase [Planctomycetes bacterium]|nr:protein kinase [Planctomycetota bacterium]
MEKQLLFVVLAFESDLLDLLQLMAACRAWVADKSQLLGDMLVQRGWISQEDRLFLDKQVERKLAKHQYDTRVTLNAITRGDVFDVLKQLDDSGINESLSSWPSAESDPFETLGESPADADRTLTRYTWVNEVGKGGLGKVWLARDNDLVRDVALKEIRPDTASGLSIRMLIKEAQITGQLQHPNIVPVYEVNRGGRPFYTMKLVKGETLANAIHRHHAELHVVTTQANAGDERDCRLAATALSMQRLMSAFLNVCDALAYAHSRGVIHRDLKPQNIVLGDFGEAIVLDWGLARKLGRKHDDFESVRITSDAQTDATRAGAVMGSPPYMAPEQAAGQIELMDQTTDVYGLGAILYEILTGQAPHRRQAADEPINRLLERIATGESPRVKDLDGTVPDELDAICAKAMALEQGDRFQTAKDLKTAVLEFQVHKESIDLASTATTDLDEARKTNDYYHFNRALVGFEQALRQWPNNHRASEGLRETRRAYAESAFHRGDYDLALSMLCTSSDVAKNAESDSLAPASDDAPLRAKIESAASERSSRQFRIRRLRHFSISACMATLVACIAVLWINAERETANSERKNAVNAREKAETLQKDAVDARLQLEREIARQIELLGLEEGLRRLVQDKQTLWLIANKRIEPLHKQRPVADTDASLQTFAAFLQTQRTRFAPESRIDLQSAGPIRNPDTIPKIAEFLRRFYGIRVQIVPAKEQLTLPESARREHFGREQWNAEEVIHAVLPAQTNPALHAGLSQQLPDDTMPLIPSEDQPSKAFRLIITEMDIWSGKLDFAFGVNDIKLQSAIMSVNRFKAGSVPDAESLSLHRAIKVAVFLVGRNYGIRDYAGYGCCMNRTISVAELDRSPLAFCPECERKVWWLAGSDPLQRYESLREFAASNKLQEAKLWQDSITAIRSGSERPSGKQ